MTAAIITAGATLIVAFITQFLAESYRRHLDGSAIAAGIAGELSSHREAAERLNSAFDALEDVVKRGVRESLPVRPFARPKDLFFSEVAGKIGVLGAEFAEDIVYVYSQLEAFRSVFGLVLEHGASMTDEEFLARVAACRFSVQEAFSRGEELLPRLKIRARERYSVRWHSLLSP